MAKKKTKTTKKKLSKSPLKASQKKVKKRENKKSSKKAVPPKNQAPSQKSVKNVSKKPGFLAQLEQELENVLNKTHQVSIRNPDGYEYCVEENCDQPATTGGYCRYHYIASWGAIKERAEILSEKKLHQWIGRIVQNYSPSILNLMMRDFSNEKDFFIALSEMKISHKNKWSHTSEMEIKEDS